MAAYRFAFRPRWILSHVLVVGLVVLMVNLGFWQLRRLDQKRTMVETVNARQAEAVAPLDAVIGADESVAAGAAVSYRRVTVTGRFDLADQVVVRSRTMDGFAGVWVMTPLVTEAGPAAMVLRGFHATPDVQAQLPATTDPPGGTVTVSGFVQPTQTRGRFGPPDPVEGRLFDFARADLDRMQHQLPDYDLFPVYVQLSEPLPGATEESPRLVPLPPLDEGPHLGYAVQWFLFSTIAIGGYPVILRRRARELAAEKRIDAGVAA
jgi:surfeit locus 1 family protein